MPQSETTLLTLQDLVELGCSQESDNADGNPNDWMEGTYIEGLLCT